MSQSLSVALVGFNPAWIETCLELLQRSSVPVSRLSLVMDHPTTDEAIYEYDKQSLMPQPIANFDFSAVDVAVFTDYELAKHYVGQASNSCLVLDQSGWSLTDPQVPLWVPDVSSMPRSQLKDYSVIALADSLALPLLKTLLPIEKTAGLTSVNVMACESASGHGQDGMYELARQSAALLSGKPFESQQFERQIAFNLLPDLDGFDEHGADYAEKDLNQHVHKVINRDDMIMEATVMRAPVFYGNALAIHVTTEQPITVKQYQDLLQDVSGVTVKQSAADYPTPVSDASGQDPVFVGRIRQLSQSSNQLAYWAVADNLRQGISLNIINALQYIA